MNKNGFSLLAFLVYLMIFSIIVVGISHTITVVIIPSLHTMRTYTSRINLNCAVDVFVKDIRSGHIFMSKIMSPTMLLWNNGEKDICWLCTDNKLERIEGKYENNTWKKRTKSIVSSGVSRVLFSFDYNNNVLVGIEMTLESVHQHEKNVAGYVAIKKLW